MTESATAEGWQTCGTEITYYTVTSTATATAENCVTASNIARILATIKASKKMQKMLTLLPPCTGPEPPTNP